MSVLSSVIVAFSCFSSIPMPTVRWDERNMRYMMAAFPLVGLVVGLGSCLWWVACERLGMGTFLRAAGLTLMPLLVTGGIHMDGFADVVDAHSSHAEPERKREILKDPHTGAFAIMGICAYLLAFLACATELDARLLPLCACIPVVSRCMSSYMAVSWKGSSTSGMFATVSSTAHRPVVLGVVSLLFLAAVGCMVWRNPCAGAAATCVALALLVWTKRFANREFGGMSGDLLGFYVQTCELAMLAAVVFAGRLG